MSVIMKRIERLEVKRVGGAKPFAEIVRRIIRPGDMACVTEHRIDLKAGQRTVTRFDGGGFLP